MTLLFGLAALAILLWAAQKYLQADPRKLAAVLKLSGGIALLGFAAFLALRGQVGVAAPLAAVGLGLLGWLPFGPAGFGARTQKSAGQVSRVRSAFLEMELDHDTGAMRGTVLSGRMQGTALDALEIPALLTLLGEIDPESRALLMAYLDRRAPRWREDLQGDAAAGQRTGAAARSGKMTEEEAYQILGLQRGATPEEISRAHRSLMKKLHPDQGGSTYLAARVNEAKDVLLRRHR